MKRLFMIAAVLFASNLYSAVAVRNAVVIPNLNTAPIDGGFREQASISIQGNLDPSGYRGQGSPYESHPPYKQKPPQQHKSCEVDYDENEEWVPVDDKLYCGCWKLFVRYEPRYIQKVRCVYEYYPGKRERCCYVTKHYKVQRCRYIPKCVCESVCRHGCRYDVKRWRYFPEYYTEIICRREPKFWYEDCCSRHEKTISEPCVEYIPRYTWRHISELDEYKNNLENDSDSNSMESVESQSEFMSDQLPLESPMVNEELEPQPEFMDSQFQPPMDLQPELINP